MVEEEGSVVVELTDVSMDEPVSVGSVELSVSVLLRVSVNEPESVDADNNINTDPK